MSRGVWGWEAGRGGEDGGHLGVHRVWGREGESHARGRREEGRVSFTTVRSSPLSPPDRSFSLVKIIAGGSGSKGSTYAGSRHRSSSSLCCVRERRSSLRSRWRRRVDGEGPSWRPRRGGGTGFWRFGTCLSGRELEVEERGSARGRLN
jgi:hypothetical protein